MLVEVVLDEGALAQCYVSAGECGQVRGDDQVVALLGLRAAG